MAAQRDEDRPGREHGRALITACGVLLAGASLAALVLTDSARDLRLAVVGALWAFLLVSITGRFRPQTEEAPSESDEELRRFYQMELQQEVAARREYELRLEVQLRRELEEARTKEMDDLRTEVHRLRAELMGIEGPERPALPAAAARLSAENARASQEDAKRTNITPRRPAERLQLPAGFSDSPPPAEAPSPSFAGSSTAPPFSPETSHPHLPAASAQPETFTPTEYIAAGSHGSPRTTPESPEKYPSAAPSYGTPDRPAAYAATEISGAYVARAQDGYVQESYAVQESYTVLNSHGVANASNASHASGTFGPGGPTPPPARSPYQGAADDPQARSHAALPRPAQPGYETSYGQPPPHSTHYANGASGAYSYSAPPERAENGTVERYNGGGRHGAPDASRPDPFDPSNTWPGAFNPARDPGPSAPRPRTPEAYPPQPAEWRPVEPPASRGRHSAGDEESAGSGDHGGRKSRPEDDVLAQILGRW